MSTTTPDSTVPTSGTPPALSSRPPSAAPGFVTACLRVFEFSLGQMIWSRRTIFLGIVVGSPVLLGLLMRLFEAMGMAGSIKMGAATLSGDAAFGTMMWLLYLRFLVPVLGVFYGTALIADEVDDKTVTYLFVRPISRSAVLTGKFLAYVVTTIFVVLPSVVVLYLLVQPMGGGSLGAGFPGLLTDLGLLALGLVAYGSLFALIGSWIKYPLVTGLFFVLGWEQLAMALPGYLRKLTLAYYLQAIVPHAMPTDGLGSALQSLFRDTPSVFGAVSTLIVASVVFLAVGGWLIQRREYVLEQ